jgi:hypothetical protein
MKAVVARLKEFNGKQFCMGNIYMVKRALHHYMAALYNALFNMLSHLLDPLQIALIKRQDMIFTNLHYVGALLNLHFIQHLELEES